MIPNSDPLAPSSSSKNQPLGGGYNSQEDSGDELFDHETIATIPLSQQQKPYGDLPAQTSSPFQYTTQPTQLLDKSKVICQAKSSVVPTSPSPVVQVPASSPVGPSPLARKTQIPASGHSYAPPGTIFRQPAMPSRIPPAPSSDDDPPVRHSSPSDDDLPDPNIKPTTFSNGNRNRVSPKSSFGAQLSKFNYDEGRKDEPSTSVGKMPLKRTADDSASSYGSARRPAKQMRQTGPARAQPVPIKDVEVTLDDIEDVKTRKSIEDMRQILQHRSVAQCRAALQRSNYNHGDALNSLFEGDPGQEPVDLTASDDELQLPHAAAPEPVAKRQIKDQGRSIGNKWSSTQTARRPNQKGPAPDLAPPSSPPPQPQRKRLIRKRQPSSSPIPIDDDNDDGVKVTNGTPAKSMPTRLSKHKNAVPAQSITVIDSDSDSGLGHDRDEGNEGDESGKSEKDLLKFLNRCSIDELADLSSQPEQSAKYVIEKRPFKSLQQVRNVSEIAGITKNRRPRKQIGEKIVEVCLDMWIGFEAVDDLVQRCETLGKSLDAAMKPLGLVAEGTGQSGELSSTRLEDATKSENGPTHDSGIGTPSSSAPCPEDDLELTKKKAAKTRIDVDDFDSDLGELSKKAQKSRRGGLSQPAMMSKDLTMKDYQLVGLNWLSVLFEHKMSGILADDMGLGKTCQVIAFLSHLVETGVTGPHLVFVPGSTLENWLRELHRFSPDLYVEPYYGSQSERAHQRAIIEDNLQSVNVIVTTYDMAKSKSMTEGQVDAKFLRRLKPVATVYDEGHILRNRKNRVYETLINIPSQFRLLLTGTPLQNNLQELISLLAFILPDVFIKHQEDLEVIFRYKAKTVGENHAGLLSARRINRARAMMTPFVLRRKKHHVLDLPAKSRRVEYCDLLPGAHREVYESQLEEEKPGLEQSATTKRAPKKHNGAMTGLRFAAIHPLLFRRLYDDGKLRKIIRAAKQHNLVEGRDDRIWEEYAKMGDFALHKYCWENPEVLGEYKLKDEEWMDSGKVKKLCEILTKFKANGDRTLIFSQFTLVMDILEKILTDLDMPFYRLDGGTAISDRLTMIDEFSEDASIPVFMLSTKAGGTGINLAAANKVIIFDSSFNPQDDVQAENRAHRVGQTREVEVIRLITKGTIEEQIYALGGSKLTMDDRVAGEGMTDGDEGKADAVGAEKVREMMMESLKKGGEKVGDAKDQYLTGLKDAGLDMSAA